MRVVVLGAGFGGLELTTRLSTEFGDAIDVVLIDQSDGFIFGFSKLDVMFGRALPSAVVHPYRDFVKPGVRFVQTPVLSIDPVTRRVETEAGVFDTDILVVALGADLDPAATPGLVEGGHEFYTVPGAFAVRDVLERFSGGRVIVAVTSTPFKCPPAPSETALLIDDYLTARGLRERSQISLIMPMALRFLRRRERQKRCWSRSPNAESPFIPSSWYGGSIRVGRSRCSPAAARCRTTCSWAFPFTAPRRRSRQQG